MSLMLDRARRGVVVAILILLPACSAAPSVSDNRSEATSPMRSNDTANALEALAVESGVIGVDATTDAVGSYGRNYEGGEDRLCMLPTGVDSKSYHFGVEIRIGEEEYCRGKGKAQRTGDLLILRFAGGRCTITAHYDGDRIVLPGIVDKGCASLCSNRGSFAGVNFPRLGLDVGSAEAVVSNDDEGLCDR